MGLLDQLFKSNPEESREIAEKRGGPERSDIRASSAPPPPTVLAPRNAPVIAGDTPPYSGHGDPFPKKIPLGPQREIVLTLGEILDRVPTSSLVAGLHDGERELRFRIEELSGDLASGVATAPLSTIAGKCPDVFRSDLPAGEENHVRLPQARVAEQMARFAQSPPPSLRKIPAAATAKPDAGSSVAPPAAAADASAGGKQIELSLAAIIKRCPRELFSAEPPIVSEGASVLLPFADIERQLPSGRVELDAATFVAALPPEYAGHFRLNAGLKVPLPMGEIISNLPGAQPVQLRERARLKPVETSPNAPAALQPTPVPASAEPSGESPARQHAVVAGQGAATVLQSQISAPATAPEMAPATASNAAKPPGSESAPPVDAVRAGPLPMPPPLIVRPAPAAALEQLEQHASPDQPVLMGCASPAREASAPAAPPPVTSQAAAQFAPPRVRPVTVPPPIVAAPREQHPPEIASPPSALQPNSVPAPFAHVERQNAPTTERPAVRQAPDFPALARELTELPGVAAAVLFTRDALISFGDLSAGFPAARIRDMALRIAAAAELPTSAELPAIGHFAVHPGERALHVFVCGSSGVGAVLRTRVFLPGVLERLRAAAASLAET